MKLWIDDIRTPPDNNWHICRDVSSAIRALEMFYEDVDEINLDHDISHQIVMNQNHRPFACTENFQAVARYIALLYRYHHRFVDTVFEDPIRLWQPKIQIHTSNRVGADTMMKILESVPGVTSNIAPGANRLETIL